MKVLVIIISYNFEPWISRCLGSLAQSDYPVDTIVIDNGSKDNTVQHIRTHYPDIRLIENQANLGFGRANNIGMQIAMTEGYDFVFDCSGKTMNDQPSVLHYPPENNITDSVIRELNRTRTQSK